MQTETRIIKGKETSVSFSDDGRILAKTQTNKWVHFGNWEKINDNEYRCSFVPYVSPVRKFSGTRTMTNAVIQKVYYKYMRF